MSTITKSLSLLHHALPIRFNGVKLWEFQTNKQSSIGQKIDEAHRASLNNAWDMTQATARGCFLAPGVCLAAVVVGLNRDMDSGLGRCLSLAVGSLFRWTKPRL